MMLCIVLPFVMSSVPGLPFLDKRSREYDTRVEAFACTFAAPPVVVQAPGCQYPRKAVLQTKLTECQNPENFLYSLEHQYLIFFYSKSNYKSFVSDFTILFSAKNSFRITFIAVYPGTAMIIPVTPKSKPPIMMTRKISNG